MPKYDTKRTCVGVSVGNNRLFFFKYRLLRLFSLVTAVGEREYVASMELFIFMVGCSNVPTSSMLVYPGILVAVIHFFSRGCWQNLCGFQATGRVEKGSRRGQEKRPTCKLAKNREIDVASFFLRTNRSPSFLRLIMFGIVVWV